MWISQIIWFWGDLMRHMFEFILRSLTFDGRLWYFSKSVHNWELFWNPYKITGVGENPEIQDKCLFLMPLLSKRNNWDLILDLSFLQAAQNKFSSVKLSVFLFRITNRIMKVICVSEFSDNSLNSITAELNSLMSSSHYYWLFLAIVMTFIMKFSYSISNLHQILQFLKFSFQCWEDYITLTILGNIIRLLLDYLWPNSFINRIIHIDIKKENENIFSHCY